MILELSFVVTASIMFIIVFMAGVYVLMRHADAGYAAAVGGMCRGCRAVPLRARYGFCESCGVKA